MKKFLLLVALAIVSTGVTNAQIKLGVKGGVNFATTSDSQTETLTAFNAGIFAQIKVPVVGLAVQPEVLYSLQGAKFSGGDSKTTLGYVAIPVMVQYSFKVIPGFNIEVGPQFGFLMSAKSKIGSGKANDIKDGMNDTEVALNFGAGFKLPVIPLGIFARYSMGLTEIGKSGDVKNRVAQLGAMYYF